MKLTKTEVTHIAPTDEYGFGWVDVFVGFEDEATGAYPNVNFRLPVAFDEDWTIERIRNEALKMAQKLAGEMTSLISS